KGSLPEFIYLAVVVEFLGENNQRIQGTARGGGELGLFSLGANGTFSNFSVAENEGVIANFCHPGVQWICRDFIGEGKLWPRGNMDKIPCPSRFLLPSLDTSCNSFVHSGRQ